MWWRQNKWKIIVPVLIAAVLAAAFWYGGGAPGLRGWTVGENAALSDGRTQETAAAPAPSRDAQESRPIPTDPADGGSEPQTAPDETEAVSSAAEETAAVPAAAGPPDGEPSDQPAAESRPGGAEGGMTAEEKASAAAAIAGEDSSGVEAGDRDYSEEQGMVIDPGTGKDRYQTDPVPEGKPIPVEPQDVTISDVAHTCTLSISCAAILDNMDWLDPEKTELVPEDGWILPPTQVTFYEGESVFNVLQRTCKQQKIHMEFENTPMYNSAYIEGIQNLYEFDCGELSGWMYKVNGWFPNYGCSRYLLHEGDTIEWVYTCDLGVDVGGYGAAAG